MNYKENNKLIAEFMGHEFGLVNHPTHKGAGYLVPLKEYHLNWNELMPVVRKINLRDYNHKGEILQTNINDSLPDGQLQATYKTVLEFIKWYNKNK